MNNPFKILNDERIQNGGALVYPLLPKPKQIHPMLSITAHKGLERLAHKYTLDKVQNLIELIGLGILQLTYDKELNTEFQIYRQIGFEDAMNLIANSFYFSCPDGTEDQKIAYNQGYVEGTFARENL